MVKRTIKLIVVFLLLFFINHFNLNASADEKEYKKNKKEYEEFKKEYKKKDWDKKYRDEDDDDDHDDHDDDDDENYEYNEIGTNGDNESQYPIIQTSSFWNVWTREPFTSPNTDLPLQVAREVIIEVEQKNNAMLFAVPQSGQLLVSGEKVAKLLGLKTEFFPLSGILVVSDNQNELIIRAGSNASFENMRKTPMPTQALFYENSIFLPISVLANAFNYRVSWSVEKEAILLQPIN